MQPSQCPQPEQLLAFALGKLDDQTADTVASHLEQCDTCAALAASLEQATDSFVAGLRRPAAGQQFLEEPQFGVAAARAQEVGGGKGDSPHLCDDHASMVPAEGPFRQMGTVPFSPPFFSNDPPKCQKRRRWRKGR